MMEKVPYALKIETSVSCLILSARYGRWEEGGPRDKRTVLQVGKFRITNAGCVFFFNLLPFDSKDFLLFSIS